MTIYVFRAQPVSGEVVPDLDLRTVQPIPDDDDSAHGRDAALIVAGLLGSLPGRTVDAVLRRLLEDRASRLRVRWPS